MRWPFRSGVWRFPRRRLPFGRYAEIRGAQHLRTLGYRLLACPYRARSGEIDIVADDAGCLVFVEVKARRRDAHPEDAVTPAKQSRIIRASEAYRRQHRPDGPYRYDILAVIEGENQRLKYAN
jgi:putative endonuclease